VHHQAHEESIFEEIGEIWSVGVVTSVLLSCVLRVTTEKRSSTLFEEENYTLHESRENPGYAYGYAAL